jgi:hypothetical protein
MRLKSITLALMLLGVGLTQTLEAKIVKFSVNMKGQTISPAGIHISGDFQTLAGFPGGDWNSATAKLTPRADFPNIYEITVNIPAFRKYEYKFVNGELFYEVEFVPEESRVGYDFVDNRWIYIDSLNNDTTFIGPLMFGGNAPEGKKMIRFVVGMNGQTIANSGVHVAGSFNGNSFTASRMYSFTGTAYEYMAYVDSLSLVTYKYANGNDAINAEVIVGNCAEDGYRSTTVSTDLVLDSLCFATCELCKTTGLTQSDISKMLKVYPNPSKDVINLELQYSTPLDYTLHSMSGVEVSAGKLQPNVTQQVSCENLAAGVYLLKVSTQTFRILVQ